MTTNEQPVNLGALLRRANEYPWSHTVYLSFRTAWNWETPCVVFDADIESDQRLPVDFEETLGMQHVQSIMRNALAQKPDASDSDLLDAFLYYYDNDAFIDFAEQKNSGGRSHA